LPSVKSDVSDCRSKNIFSHNQQLLSKLLLSLLFCSLLQDGKEGIDNSRATELYILCTIKTRIHFSTSTIMFPLLALLFCVVLKPISAWQSSNSRFVGAPVVFQQRKSSASTAKWTMRDRSASYWFQAGDRVRVVDDVYKAGTNLRQRVGVVVETWEKCDVDPTCCCAEQVDTGMAVRVEFERDESNKELLESSFMHYFAEEELLKVKEEEVIEAAAAGNEKSLPFDGMSCTAFKLEQLQTHQKPRGIASFEPVRAEESTNKS
jgi:hypothetical protein